jgi:hypothetical protein
VAIVNGYCTLTPLKAAIGIADTTDDTPLEDAVEAASRQIDGYCGKGRKFWQDSTVVARYYYGCGNVVYVDDISTATGLLVKVDQDDDGTFETSLTINTDFKLHPLNAAAEWPVRPWTRILLLNNTLTSFTPLTSGRANVEVTAKFGWSAIPDAVERATVLQARSIFKAPDTTFGVFAAGLDGQARQIPRMDPSAAALLEDFIRYDPVDDGA